MRRNIQAWTARAAMLAASLVIALALVEIGLRIVSRLAPDLGRHLDLMGEPALERYGSIGYRQKPHRELRYYNGTKATSNAQGFRGPSVVVPKPAGTFRIVLLGGSTTHGWAVDDDQTIDAYMREQLRDRYPERSFDVVNLAYDGYDSYQVVERLRSDGLRLEPDLLIVNSGINDVRNARVDGLKDPDPRALIFNPDPGSTKTLTAQLMSVSFLARLLRLLHLSGEKRGATASAEPIVPNHAAAEYYERNLRRVVDLVRERHVPILFSTPPSSLATKYSPDHEKISSYWLNNAAETEAYRQLLAERAQHVTSILNAEQYPAHHIRHVLADEFFSDDCHLTADGNRALARAFVTTAAPVLGRSSPPPSRFERMPTHQTP